MHSKGFLMLIALLGMLSLTACEKVERGYGDGDTESEEVRVIKGFYHAIYLDDDLTKAKQFASNRMDGLIDHFATLNGVERYILGRYFTNVELRIESDSIVPYLNNSQERRVTVIFDGTYQDETVKDSRDVVLVQEQGQWRVDQILDPRYRP